MNSRMYLHPATRANLDTLRARGVTVVPPGEGELASHGEQGIGRLAEPAELLEACERLLTPPSLSGLRVVVTAGGTREPIDSVRYVGNRSSGRMGVALAGEAARRGADVTLIAANVAIDPPAGIRTIPVQTAAELARACRNEIAACDVLLMSAAVADFRPAGPVDRKLKKDQGIPKLELEATEDVLSLLAERRRSDQVIVGFAAEHGEDAVELGRGKLERKRLDAIVVNDISRAGIGFEAEDNEVTILTADGEERHVARSRKERVARAVLDEVERLRATRGARGTDGARAGTRSPARV
jgi:phosphopantothenoylcysteine decarboxylase/phosphopantothenate--cysteine ligase